MSDFVQVAYKAGPRKGQKTAIPRHWLDDPEGLGKNFRLVARASRSNPDPHTVDDAFTADAQTRGLDTEDAPQTPAAPSRTTNTPRDGDRPKE